MTDFTTFFPCLSFSFSLATTLLCSFVLPVHNSHSPLDKPLRWREKESLLVRGAESCPSRAFTDDHDNVGHDDHDHHAAADIRLYYITLVLTLSSYTEKLFKKSRGKIGEPKKERKFGLLYRIFWLIVWWWSLSSYDDHHQKQQHCHSNHSHIIRWNRIAPLKPPSVSLDRCLYI